MGTNYFPLTSAPLEPKLSNDFQLPPSTTFGPVVQKSSTKITILFAHLILAHWAKINGVSEELHFRSFINFCPSGTEVVDVFTQQKMWPTGPQLIALPLGSLTNFVANGDEVKYYDPTTFII